MIDYTIQEDILEAKQGFYRIGTGESYIGICRYCGKVVKRLKNKKHLRTHYLNGMTCAGSRRLDFYNRGLLKISESFDKI